MRHKSTPKGIDVRLRALIPLNVTKETFCYITLTLKFIGMGKAQFWGRGSRVKTVKAIDEAFRQVV